MPDLNIQLTQTGTDFITVLPDGTEYKTTASAPHMNSIGEKKRIKWKFSSSYANLEGVNVYIQLGLFQQGVVNAPNPKVPVNYEVTFPVGLAAGDYPMALMLPSGANANLNFNASVTLRILTSSTFHIVVDFFQIYDEMQYQNVSFQDNHKKLLLDQKQSTSELTIGTVNNCYNSTSSQFAITMKLEKPGVIHAPDTYLYTDNALAAYGTGVWSAGFYNRNGYDDPPYFNTPVWEFTRSAVAVTNLSGGVDTDVLFKITAPTSVSKVLFWVIRTDKFDNTETMFDNYEANLEEIVNTNANIGATGMILTTPVNNIASLGAGVFSVGCSLKGANLVSGGKYRMIAIVYYSSGAAFYVNSFISNEMIVDANPCYVGDGFDVIGSLSDYDREFTGSDLECVIEERIKSKIYFDYTANQWADDILDRLGITTSNDFRRYLTKVKFDIYDENNVVGLGVVRNYYISETSNKYGINSYTSVNGMNLDFTNIDEPIFSFDWRNRFENNIDCLLTTIDNVPVTPVQAKQYWGGKTLKVRWQLFFYYDDYATPFEDIIEMFQQIRVLDYGNMKVLHDNVDGIRSNWNETANCCQGDEFCMGGVLDNSLDAIDRRLIVNICPNLASVNNLEEAEAWVGDELPQMTTMSITNEDIDYTTIYTKKAARFCIDTSKLSVNSYKISAMAKKYVA